VSDSPPNAAGLGFRPLRVATILGVVIGGAVLLNVLVARASFADGLAVVVMLPGCIVATPRAIGLWRGTVAHTEITFGSGRPRMSLDGARAFTPCAVIAIDGLIASFLILLVTGGKGSVAEPLMLACGGVAVVFILAGFVVAATRHPRFLLPATMRPGRS
jgi:hypothetical protein